MKEKVGFIVLLLSQAALASKDPEVVCSSKPVEAAVGEDVILQCHLEPPLDATDMTVEWSHGHLNHSVHLYQDRKDNPAEQKEHLEGRTSLFDSGLTKGNLSLKLSSARLSDAGRYKCSFHTEKLQKSCCLNLTVAENEDNKHEKQAGSGHKVSRRLRNVIFTGIVIVIIVIVIAIILCRRNSESSSLVAECLVSCLVMCVDVCQHLEPY
ncbi:myelin-oligodendrocyte glycoprotein-like isoform X1 [Siniperca chuatsi]|uniref:myelin-oligodendrocyte glycoprotein-like isoform X1 n=1 Tax=Siniperca chuatsi TaxID=119488 RepID=UPI001CE0BB9C|nr:myelin-oligodendrocyte glycoprotein-like isoform X1 [Siniperca chuatsi]